MLKAFEERFKVQFNRIILTKFQTSYTNLWGLLTIPLKHEAFPPNLSQQESLSRTIF